MLERETRTPDEQDVDRLICTCKTVAEWTPIVIGGLGILVAAAWLLFAFWLLIEVLA